MFEAKNVPIESLNKLEKYREYHRKDWVSVQLTIGRSNKGFDVYFDRVIGLVAELEPGEAKPK